MIQIARHVVVNNNPPATVLEDVEPSYQKGVWAIITDDNSYCVVHAPSGMVLPNYLDGGQHFENYDLAVLLVDRFYSVVPNIANTATPGIVPKELEPVATNYVMLLDLIKQ